MKKLALLLLAMTTLWSCGKYDLYYPAPAPGTATVRFVPNQEVHKLFTEATVCIYQGNTSVDSRTDLLDTLVFTLPEDSYNILLLASGKNIKYRNLDNFEKAEAYVDILTNRTKSEGMLYVPNTDSLYHVSLKDYRLDHETLEVPTLLTSKSKRLYMELELEKEAVKIDATLSGVAVSLNLSTGQPNYETMAYLTDLQTLGTDHNKATLTCTYFGVMPTPPVITPETPKHNNEIDIIIDYKDGTSEETGTDITDIFDHPDPDKPNDITVQIKKVEGTFRVVGWRYGTGSGTVTGIP